MQLQQEWYILLRQRIQSVRVCRLAGQDGRVALSSDKDSGANLGQSAGARAIEARAAIATAQLRSTVKSISSSVGCTSAHGQRIVDTIDDLVDDVIPELEAAEALAKRSERRTDDAATGNSSLWVQGPSTMGVAS